MIDVDQYILLFIQIKTEEIKKFKRYIQTSDYLDKEISQSEWETLYLNWAITQDECIEKSGKMPKIYLNED